MLAIINDSCWCSKLKSKWAASRLWRVFWCVADLFWDALKTASSDWGPIVDKLQNTWYGWQCQLDSQTPCQLHQIVSTLKWLMLEPNHCCVLLVTLKFIIHLIKGWVSAKAKKMQFLSMLIDQPLHLIQGVKHSFQDQLEVNPMWSIINPGREQFPATDKWFIDHYRQPSQ